MSVNLTINGTSLHTYAWNVVNRAGRWRMPGRRGSNIVMPGIHGSSQVRGKVYNENTLTFNMWAVGANPDGSMPADKDAERKCLENLDNLSRIFAQPVLDVRQTLNDGSVRQCFAEVVQTVDFSSMAGGSRAEFAVELVVPGSFWFDLAPTTQTLTTGVVTSKTLNFTSFSSATAPLVNAIYEVVGPVSSPTLANPVTGQWVRLSALVPAGQVWRVDSSAWTTMLGGVNQMSVTTHGQGTSFLDLTPSSAGPSLFFTGTSTSLATAVRVIGKRAYFLA